MERTNVRYLDTVIEEEKFSGYEFEELRLGRIMMAAIDVSFISLAKVVPTVLRFLVPDGEILALVKPQFEVGKGKVGKGGVVRDHEKRVQAVRDVQRELEASGLKTVGIFQSPVTGQKGNIEYFLYMKR
jgi:23S rRNA (cytidine1920-2'-O)/16S rRNA (cytidine1409-2'-O)-methyltransferase